jgi:hypothetical protein
MKLHSKIAVLPAVLALAVAPAAAMGAPAHPTGKPADTPGPHATLPAKAKAYGRYCKTESKTHTAGQKGTPFSQCVTAMAKLASGKTDSPRAACSAESKQHVKGEKGTPFSRCVSGAAKLKADEADQADGSDDTTTNTGDETTSAG